MTAAIISMPPPVVERALGSTEQAVLDFAIQRGDFTDGELKAAYPDAPESTYRKRRTELVRKGFLMDTGMTRANRNGREETVWQCSANAPELVVIDLSLQARDLILKERKARQATKKNHETIRSCRLESGRCLLELKTMIDADNSLSKGKTFWVWFQDWYVRDNICSRKDAEKRMAMARSDDPEGALADERRRNREQMAAHRAKNSPAHNDDVCGSQQQEGDENVDPDYANEAQDSDSNVVSLRVSSALRIVREMTPAERDQFYVQLREENLL